jgi:hypothetical protein
VHLDAAAGLQAEVHLRLLLLLLLEKFTVASILGGAG